MDWISIIKEIGAAISVVIPTVKQRLAERKAGVLPESVPISLDEELMDDALRRLGSIQPSDSWWKKAIADIESVVLRPETFCKPAVRDWLSLSPVRVDLKAATRAKLSRHEIPKVIFERLVGSYTSSETTGEHRSYAESAIYTAVAYLQNSVHGSVHDPGGAAITQATALHTVEIVEEGFANLTQTAGLVRNPHIAPRFTEEAQRDLFKILRRRATPGQDTAGDLMQLIGDFEDGHRLAAADRAAKQETRYWLCRVEAGSDHPEVAEAMLSQLASEGFNVSEAAWGLVELGKAQPTQALRRLRDLRDMDSQAVIFHIQLKTNGAKAALTFVDEIQPSDPSTFTPIGWNNICATLINAGRINDAVVYLKMLPHDVLRQCTHLYYMYAVSCLLPMVSPDRYISVMQEGFPIADLHF